jgi:hypothetical protein
MGIFPKNSKLTSNTGFVANLQGTGTYEYEIVGESHYQDALTRICGGKTYDGHEKIVRARLIHENDNPHDTNAVRVEINDQKVGYLSRDDAKNYRKQLSDAGHQGIDAVCSAMIVGGWEREDGDVGEFGVRLDIPTIENN